MNHCCFNHCCCFITPCVYSLVAICIHTHYKESFFAIRQCWNIVVCTLFLYAYQSEARLGLVVCVFFSLCCCVKDILCGLFCTAQMWLHMFICEFWVSTLHFVSRCHLHKRDIKKSRLTPVCRLQISTAAQLIHLWVTTHQHQSLLHRHQCGVAQRSSLYVWYPRVVPHRAFILIPLILTWPVSHRESVFREGRFGWDGIRRGGAGWFLFLLSSSFPSPPPCFFYLCVNIMFTCSSLNLFHFLAIVFCPLCSSPLPHLTLPSSFLSLHFSASHCCD